MALIVVGPKDLPMMFRKVGQFTGRVRGMAKEFSRAMDDAAGETGVKDISKDLRNLSNPKKMGLDAVNKAFEGIDPTKYPEGSETRKLAEKRKAAQDDTKARIEEQQRIRAEKNAAAEAPAEAAPAPSDAPADPGEAPNT